MDTSTTDKNLAQVAESPSGKANVVVTPVNKNGDNSWIYWTILCVGIFLIIFIIVSAWDIITRYRSKINRPTVFDGGPPATPTHSFTYKVAIKADAATSTFNLPSSVIRVELLDSLNRYITSVAVPCFLLKFKHLNSKTSSTTLERPGTPPKPDSPSPDLNSSSSSNAAPAPGSNSNSTNEKQTSERRTPSVPFIYAKTMTILQEQWANTPQSDLLSFDMVKRRQLQDVRSARVSHDCYLEDAIIKLKYFVIYDPIAKINWMVDLKDKLLKAVDPCPASGFQVFPVERVQHNDDLKSFVELTKRKYFSWVPSFLRCDRRATV